MPDMKVIATGGLARVIDPDKEIFDVLDPVLTLKGLRILYEKNKNRFLNVTKYYCFFMNVLVCEQNSNNWLG